MVVGKSHVGVYKLISNMRKELIVALTRLGQMENGEIRLPKKKTIIKKNEKINNIIKKRKEISKLDFLKRIAYNIELS